MNENLAADVAAFLAHKRALGREYLSEEATLHLLLAYTDQHGVTGLAGLTPRLLDDFVASRPRGRARSFNHLIGVLGTFLDWAVSQQLLAASPWHGSRRRETDERLPFLLDSTQARRLLEAAAELPDNPRARGRGRTYHAIFALCYGLGLRGGGPATCAWKTLILAGRSWSSGAGSSARAGWSPLARASVSYLPSNSRAD